jgi:hypothetical protein
MQQQIQQLSVNEVRALLWVIGILLGILGFVGVVFVNYFIKLVNDVGSIKTNLEVHGAKHEALEERVSRLEDNIPIKFKIN